MRSLSAMISSSFYTEGNEVNNAGVVAGAAEIFDGKNAPQRPFVWDLATYDSGTGLATGFAIGVAEDGTGAATDVNDGVPAQVVGTMTRVVGSTPFPYAFSHSFGSSPTSFVELEPFPGQLYSSAQSASVSSSSGDALVAGTSSENNTGFPPVTCDDQLGWNGIRWTLLDPPPAPPADPYVKDDVREDFLTSGPIDLLLWKTESRAVNSSGMTGGHYFDPELSCKRRAAFWSAGGIAQDLGGLTGLDPLAETTVNAMTDVDSSGGLIIVGTDQFTIDGVVWWRSSGAAAFTATLASSLDLHPCEWSIESLTDINEKGWIVGVGRHSSPTTFGGKQRALLLVPDTCVADLTGDDFVDGADLGALLGGWGVCPTPTNTQPYCLADLNCSGGVDGADLGILLGAWGNTCVLCDEGFQSMAMSTAESGDGSASINGPAAFLSAIGMFGFVDVDEFAEWYSELSSAEHASVAEAIGAAMAGGGM
ncbi:MAG: hypothetical protein JNM94_03225 [Phycisphaerae bacterium]|nr:hypothetical protein [Phycisphaerae bacterium]